MSAISYSKWDNLTLSDDSDTECHPNIDKKSFIKWKREALHKERDERRDHLQLMERNQILLKSAIESVKQNPEADLNQLFKAIPKLEQDLPKFQRSQYAEELQRVYDLIQKDYLQLKKKEEADLSVDKVCHEGFSTTRVNVKKQQKSKSPPENPEDSFTASSDKKFVTVNQPGLFIVPDSLKNNRTLLQFVGLKNIEEIYNFIQSNPEIVDSKNQETLLSAAFEYAFAYGEKLKASGVKNPNVEKDELFKPT
eukprot:NODE_700_length_4628_cov_1.474718.p2 type:complete len:252 gc:universal NODE_700_length_4628_cov_1.474718:1098-343(-)